MNTMTSTASLLGGDRAFGKQLDSLGISHDYAEMPGNN
jgi:hypothetical protein